MERLKGIVLSTLLLVAIMLPTLALAQGRPISFAQATNMTLSDGFKALKSGNPRLAYDKFWQVAAAAPSSEAGGTANFTLGNASRKCGNLEYAKEYYRRGFDSQARIAADSGISLANVYLAQGKKSQAAEAFILVKQRFAGSRQADSASLKAGMCYIGMARTDVKNRPALKQLALNFLAQSSDPEARIQELGILWEKARDKEIPWQKALNKLASFEQDFPNASDSAKARAILMQAEQAYIVDDYERCMDKSQEVMDRFPGAKTEYYAALYTQTGALQALGRDGEAIVALDKIIGECQDNWNFAGNNVRASAAYWKIQSLKKLGLRQETAKAINLFKQTWPNEKFYTPFLEVK